MRRGVGIVVVKNKFFVQVIGKDNFNMIGVLK